VNELQQADTKEHLLFFFDRIAGRDDVFIKGYTGGQPADLTGMDIAKSAESCAAFLKGRGIGPGDRVIVIAEKCPETVISFFGIWLCGGIAVPVCETLKDRELSYIFRDSGAGLILCSDALKEKMEAVAGGTEAYVCGFSLFRDAVKGPGGKPPSSDSRNPDDTAFLVYTSGSMGNPKGVVQTHRNIFVNAAVSADYIGMTEKDAVMSILPYWHCFALTAELFTMLHSGGKIFIPKTKSTFLKDAVLMRPTIILSIPRLAEMLKKGIESSAQKKPAFARKMLAAAQSAALGYHRARSEGRISVLYPVYRMMQKAVLKKMKEIFGGRIKYFIGGGAPLDVTLQEFFLSIDIPMYQGYGLTEASPVISINSPLCFKPGTSGKIIPWLTGEHGGDYCFEDENGKRGKGLKGELLAKGRCVMKGYWNMKEETSHAVKDGWLRTGDMGFMDADGFLIISGRRKNLLCLKGGEKFYPEFVEERLKQSSLITQAMVVGEGCARCSVLVNVSPEKTAGLSGEDINRAVSKEIRELTQDFEPYQRPFRHLVLPEFTAEDDLLTSTQKIRRHKVFEKYGREIGRLLMDDKA
jgi:long-chain acyl-CoA synthetase